jgi:DNA-binding SARP family transcriptional activator
VSRSNPKAEKARIFLLGQFAVEVGFRAIPASSWTKRRPVEVLAAVALSQGHTLHREELIDRVWPDKDLDAGANNLHRALHDLRRVTSVDLVTLDRGVARLADDIWVDVDAFERGALATDKEALAAAVSLYRGLLLPDDPYSDALAARREGLRQRFIDAGLRLATLQHDAAEPEACIAVLRRMLDQDAALEPAHQLLMRTLAETGRTADALRQFAECTSALRAKLDASPSRATADLRAAIERGDLASAPTATPTSAMRPSVPPPAASPPVDDRLFASGGGRPMVGRDAALASVSRFIEAGRGVLLVAGEAGLGKTRLAGECARVAAKAGAAVLAGIGLDRDSGVPYAAFADAWAHHRRATGAPEDRDPFVAFAPSGGSAQEDRLRLFQSVERSIEALAGTRSVCLVIEDLHQADQSGLHLFHHLARATRSLPLLLVGTLREEEAHTGSALHTLLGSLGRERLGTRVALERLDLAATRRLVSAYDADATNDELVNAVHALAEGNPFHTEEVLQAMREEGTSRPSLPKNLLETVRHRVRRLGRDAERFLSAAALVGQRFPFDVAQRAAGLDAELALEALDLAFDARLVEEETDEYRFRHALTREALMDALTNARRIHLHRAVADALEHDAARRDERAESLAHHHEGAGQLDRALPYLLSAAARAQSRLGFTEAISFFERALSLMDALGRDDGAERFRILRNTGGMRMALSDLDGAVRDLDAAAALDLGGFHPNATETALAKRVAALALIQGGRLAEASARLEDAVTALRGSTDDPELPAVLYLFAQLRWHQEKYAEAKELAQRSLAEAEARGDRAAMAKGHEMLALACHSLGSWQEGNAHETERQALADGALDVDQAFDVHLCLWEYHLYGEQSSAGIRGSVDRTLEQARRMNAPRAVALCESFAGTLDFQGGKWDEAQAQLERAIERFRQVGSASGEALSLQRLAVLLTARGELEASRALLDDGIVVGGRAAMRSHCLTRLHATLARNRLAAGDRDGARTSLEEGLAEAARHGNCATCSALLLPEAVRVALAWDDVRGADASARKLEDVAARFDSRAWTAMAEHARARVHAARGDTQKALDGFERARVAYQEVGAPYDAARCMVAQSRLVASAKGKRKDAVGRAAELADEARRIFAALGASEIEA